MMDYDMFKKAVDSMDGFNGCVGIIGGEPTLHPEFERFAKYVRCKRVNYPVRHCRQPIEDMLVYIRQNMIPPKASKAGLWSSLNKGYYEHFEVINDTFQKQFLNDHDNTCLHQALLMPRKELGIPDEEWVKKRDACWVQNTWSATITPKGAFFCEVAGALDMLFHGPGGWPVEPGWWKREPKDFTDQLHWCELCSGCLDVPQRISNDERDDVTPGMLEKLKEIGSPKALRGDCVVMRPEDYDSRKYHTFTGNNDYMEAAGNKRTSKRNRNPYPKEFLRTTRENLGKALLEEKPGDWIIVADDEAKGLQAEDYLKDTIINPGCIYLYGDVTIFNVRARSIQEFLKDPNAMHQNLWGYYPADKVIPVKPRLPMEKCFAIYGAGDRGKYAMKRLGKEHWRGARVTAWVDSDADRQEFPVQCPEVLREVSFDYVILAVEDSRARDTMEERLLGYGIERRKILWTMEIPW